MARRSGLVREEQKLGRRDMRSGGSDSNMIEKVSSRLGREGQQDWQSMVTRWHDLNIEVVEEPMNHMLVSCRGQGHSRI